MLALAWQSGSRLIWLQFPKSKLPEGGSSTSEKPSSMRLLGEHASAVIPGTVTIRTGLPVRSSPGSQLTKAPLRHPATMPLPCLQMHLGT